MQGPYNRDTALVGKKPLGALSIHFPRRRGDQESEEVGSMISLDQS